MSCSLWFQQHTERERERGVNENGNHNIQGPELAIFQLSVERLQLTFTAHDARVRG